MKLWMLLTKCIKKKIDDPILDRTVDILDRFSKDFNIPIRDPEPYYWLMAEIHDAIKDLKK